jgi:hypothetical protein
MTCEANRESPVTEVAGGVQPNSPRTGRPQALGSIALAEAQESEAVGADPRGEILGVLQARGGIVRDVVGRLSANDHICRGNCKVERWVVGGPSRQHRGGVPAGPRAAQPRRRLRSAASAQTTSPRGARLEGFSLHTDGAVSAPRRDRGSSTCAAPSSAPRWRSSG